MKRLPVIVSISIIVFMAIMVIINILANDILFAIFYMQLLMFYIIVDFYKSIVEKIHIDFEYHDITARAVVKILNELKEYKLVNAEAVNTEAKPKKRGRKPKSEQINNTGNK